jgi:hypothetical protein
MPNELIQMMRTGRSVPPVVNNAKLAQMTEKPLRPRVIGGRTIVMAADPKPDTGRQGRMAPVAPASTRLGRIAQPTLRRELPDMQEAKLVAQEPKKEGYVRLRLRVADGTVSVVGATAVPGPLVERERIHGALAYEVTLGTKRVAAGSVPDVGERRSFPSPDGPPEQQGHFISTVPVYDVNVRVPASEVTMASLPRLDIRLYRVKDEIPRERIRPGILGDQFPKELREVARVKGIKAELLAAPLRAQLRKALG